MWGKFETSDLPKSPPFDVNDAEGNSNSQEFSGICTLHQACLENALNKKTHFKITNKKRG